MERDHLHSTVNLCQVTVGDHLRWLVADTDLEASWTPVNELNGTLGLEGCNSGVDILWYNITTVQQACCHVLSVTWVTLHHLVVWFEARHGDLLDGVRLVRCLCSRDNWSIGDEREMDTWVWDQVGLELVEINVEGTIETERSGD
jgi:hypothetical protein